VEEEKAERGGGMKRSERKLRRNKRLTPPLAVALRRKKTE